MKKIFLFIATIISLTSCYGDYVKDYDYSGVYFTKQVNTRTVVVGEALKFEIGAVLAGVIENKNNREVIHNVDNSLVTSSILEQMKNGDNYIKQSVDGIEELIPMPEGYVNYGDYSKIIIPKGDHLGKSVIKVDSVKFLSDPLTVKANYVIPIKIMRADADTILESKNTTVIGLKYENMLFGNYYHGGTLVVKDGQGNVIKTVNYFTSIPQADNQVWNLTTVAPHSLTTNKIGDSNINGGIKLTLNNDGSISIESIEGTAVNVYPDGECKFNRSKLLQNRKIFLKYKYDNGDGTTSFATDTLTFRNRMRDGINEWQDENKDNYN